MIDNALYLFLILTIISLASMIGAIFFYKHNLSRETLTYWLSFASGAMIGNAVFNILPEIASFRSINVLALGILTFFILEKFFYWVHCHIGKDHIHPMGWMNLLGDGLHNLFDGIAIGASFFIDPWLGLTTAIAVALHEIPQEMGDFALLIYAGFRFKSALLWNALSALASIAGGMISYFLFSSYLQSYEHILLGIVAGGFLYIALADIMPEMHKTNNLKSSVLQTTIFVIALTTMYVI